MPAKRWQRIVLLSGILITCGAAAILAGRPYLYALFSFMRSLAQGPQIVLSAFSPDAEFEAYVVEQPSVDPPNQVLYIQRRQGDRFVMVAHLAEDVDSVQDIQWAPGSEMVVFITSNNLIAVRTPGFETLKIPLDTEFARYFPGKFSTYGGGIPHYQVQAVTFPEPGVFVYQLESLDRRGQAATLLPERTVHLDQLLGEPLPYQ